MEKIYDHRKTETKWYQFWERSGFFAPKVNPKKNPYTIIMPPPNANGELHVGHATFIAIEDILIRYHRMKGDPSLWLPGADHAGILTQVVFERELEKQGKTRFDLGREEFFKQTYAFTMKNKKHMESQLKALGASCDWTRGKFTLDPKITKAVYTTFKKLYDDGLIYRGERIINWCIRCGTALSDLEVEHEERKGKLWYIKYPIKNSKRKAQSAKVLGTKVTQNAQYSAASDAGIEYERFIVVATTRPETMLGDTAVAVNPDDKRYKNLVGQIVTLPLMNREIPIIADAIVDPKFGTGAIKVTPGHDPIDFEIGQKHQLKTISVIGADGLMSKESGQFSQLKISEASEKVVAALEKEGLVEKVKEYTHSVGVCERCRRVVEPLVSKQWFVKIKPLAEAALQAVKKGDVKILPKRFEKIYFNWLENIRDWCISRQIWWGQQIPVWYCGDPNFKRMGFAESVVPQVFAGKTKTYRLRNHGFKVGDRVVFENSSARRVFGHGIMNTVVKTTVDKLPLNDPAHGATYQKVSELIAAFKRHNPEKEVKEDTPAFIYGYEFTPAEKLAKGCGEIIAATEEPTKCPTCGNTKLTQDPDTLDTWFSSGQWPYTTLGWPKGQRAESSKQQAAKTSDFDYFYPTSVMETGYDILFFWVARMIMLGLYATGKPPFHTVFLHGLVRDEQGKKMSKSKGNVIDPLNVADKYGADAVRLALVFGTSPGNDVSLGESKIKGMRNFTNKLWNIGRYILSDEFRIQNSEFRNKKSNPSTLHPVPFAKEDKWILDELEKTRSKVTKDIENYRFGQAAEEIYDFVWHKFADKYIEHSKGRREEAQPVLEKVFEESLILLHPFMPFITEDLWQKLPTKKGKSIMVSDWPKND
jgi:valyl-tRNA synthetase